MVQRIESSLNDLLPYLEFTDRIPYDDMINELRNSNTLLLLTKKDANWLHAKLFDLLLAQKPILCMENDHGIIDAILKESNCSSIYNSKEEAVEFLEEKYKEFKMTGTNVINYNNNWKKYSRKTQTKTMSNIIGSIKYQESN